MNRCVKVKGSYILTERIQKQDEQATASSPFKRIETLTFEQELFFEKVPDNPAGRWIGGNRRNRRTVV